MVSRYTLHQSSVLSNTLLANAIRLLKSRYSIEILQTWKYEENSRGKRGALIKSRPFQSTCFQIKLIPLISCLIPCFSFLCLLHYSVCASSRLPMALLGGQILISHHFNATDSLGSHRNSKYGPLAGRTPLIQPARQRFKSAEDTAQHCSEAAPSALPQPVRCSRACAPQQTGLKEDTASPQSCF